MIMSPKQITDTLKSTVWLRSPDECDAGFSRDADGYKRRWEIIVYYSQCGRFRKEYHVNRDKEEFYFQLRASHGEDQEDMPEYSSFSDLLRDYEEMNDIQQQLEL